MNLPRNSQLALIAAVLSSLVCGVFYYYNMDQSDDRPGLCKMQMIDGVLDPSTEICEFPCPQGPSVIVNRSQLEAASTQGFVDTFIICELPPRTETYEPTETPTETPMPTDTPTLPPPAPLLTGQVTACSRKDGFINFQIAEGAPEVHEGDVLLTINEVQVTCIVAGTNRDVLSCALPPGVIFPAAVHVVLGGIPVHAFEYNGDDCAVIPENKPPSEDGPPVVPTLD